jgi:penicillin-binding protein 1B
MRAGARLATTRKKKTTTRKKTRAHSPRRRTKPPERPGRRWLRSVGLALAIGAFAAGFVTAGYIVHLDRIVVARFEGKPFQVPSRVFAAPTILYPGLDHELVDLRGILARLGYREATETRDMPPGRFVWKGGRVRIHLRAFAHPTRPEPARDVVLRLSGRTIDAILELPRGREIGAVLMEPEPIGAYYGPDREQRELVTLDEVPDHLIDAILAVEDQRFQTHPGIDLRRIVGAMLANLRAGSIRQGGSTLTQQLVKNFFLTPERTFKRKLQEAVMALIVELRFDKRDILTAYLNEIYFGQRGSTAIHGVGEASHLYFGKPARDLAPAESALIAAIIQSPNGLSPYRDPTRAIKRRNLVLELMYSQGRIEQPVLDAALAAPLQLASVTPDPSDARYFLDLLRRQLSESYDTELLASEGLRIYSTLDRRLQRIAAESLRGGIEQLETRYPKLKRTDPTQFLQGCLIALRPQTGELLALVGGRSYGLSQFDRCTQALRPTGSVFKPFVYIAALEPGRDGPFVTLADFLDDSPLEISTPQGKWRPENYDHKWNGRVPIRTALERSLNVSTARLADEIGIRKVADVAQRLGVTSKLPLVPSLALGAADVSPLDIARAYATIASGGVRPDTQTIEDLVNVEGQTLERRKLRFERVLDPGSAFLITSMLNGVAKRGTAARVFETGLRGPIAAKTGTSDRERDLWFVGFTPELVAVVWLGFDEPQSLGIPSSVGALPVWRQFVQEATGGLIRGDFRPPAEVEIVEIDPATGARALDGCPRRKKEYFLVGTAPSAVCPAGALPPERERERRESDRGFFEWLRRQL